MITITGTDPYSDNRGVAAMCMATLKIMKAKLPNEKINLYFSMPNSSTYSSLYSKKYINNSYINIIVREDSKLKYAFKLHLRLWLCIMWNILIRLKIDTKKILFHDKILKTYLQSDVIISLNWGDDFTDIYGIVRSILWTHEYLIKALLDRPIIFFPQTIGPFNNLTTHIIAKFILNKTTLIMVRENCSLEYLINMGIEKQKILLIPDTALILEPIDPESTEKILSEEQFDFCTNQMIGISLRDLFNENCVTLPVFENYFSIMCETIDYLVDEYKVDVLFIPHSGISDEKYTTKKVTLDIINKIKHKDKVHSIDGREYAVEELKGMIGKCELFIGAYMHANVSSLSMCVPTIGLSYSHKFKGIFEMMGQEKYVCDLNNLTFEILISTIENAWVNRDKIRNELMMKMDTVKREVMFSGELVENVIGLTQLN